MLATQTLVQRKAKTLLVDVEGELPRGVTAKDIALAVIGRIGTAGGTGYAIEFAGSAIRALSMEGRMTLCNMAIEAGARAGMVAVDDTTIDYLKGRPSRPRAICGTARWRTGARCRAIRTRSSTAWCGSTRATSSRRSPGARRPKWWSPSTAACPTRTRKRTRSSAKAWSARCSTWA